MNSPHGDRPQSLKALCDAVLANELGRRQGRQQGEDERNVREIFESIFQSSDPLLRKVPAVKSLRHAVQNFVKKHSDVMFARSSNDTAEVDGVSFSWCDNFLRDKEVVEAIYGEWRRILESEYTVASDENLTLIEMTGAVDGNLSSNTLDCSLDDGAMWVDMQVTERASGNSASEFLDSCVRAWEETGQPICREKAGEFISAFHEVVDMGLDVISSGDHWEFWVSSLLFCVGLHVTSCDAIATMELLYNQSTSQRRLFIMDRIAERIRLKDEGAAGGNDIFLQLFHRLLLSSQENNIVFTHSELTQLLVQGLCVASEYLVYFNMIDPQAGWLKGLLMHPPLVRTIAFLPKVEPDLVKKLADAMPTSHAVGLMLTMLPLWVRGFSDTHLFKLIFRNLVDAVMNGQVLCDLVDDVMTCIERCVCGICLDERLEFFVRVYKVLMSRKRKEMGEFQRCLLRLLLRFLLPSVYEPERKYKLPLVQVESLEEEFLARSETWSRINAANRGAVSDFWWELLRWYAADLPKVVARVVWATCQHEGRLELPWDEKHLVAVSYSFSPWRELNEWLEDEESANTLNYAALLNRICASGLKVFSSSKQQQEQQQEEEKEQQQHTFRVGPDAWWLLMRWCTNPHLRRGLFLATSSAIQSLMQNIDVNEGILLPVPVEEFDVPFHMPHNVPTGVLRRQRSVALLLSVRLWIAALSPPMEHLILGKLDIKRMLVQQLRTYWVDYKNDMTFSERTFGEDSFVVLLCVYVINRLTEIKRADECCDEHIVQKSLSQLLKVRVGLDPVRLLLQFLTTGVSYDNLAIVLTHRFEAVLEVSSCLYIEEEDRPFLQQSVGEKELSALQRLLNMKEKQERTHHLTSVLRLLLQLHAGDVSCAAAAFKTHPVSLWDAYGRFTELAVGVVEYIFEKHPNVEGLMRCEGVDIYYLSLICVGRWLRDPVRSLHLANTSIKKFVHLGATAWVGLVADSLVKHVISVREELLEVNGLSCSAFESNIFPVSLVFASCLTREFNLL